MFRYLFLLLSPLMLAAQDTSYPNLNSYAIKEPNGVSIKVYRFSCERNHPEARTILLVHGGSADGFTAFHAVPNSFAGMLTRKGFVVYIMDVRGWGKSTAPAYKINDTTAGSYKEAAADIDAVIEFIRDREHIASVNLLGWAAGGHWASYYTTIHNDKIDHLIVLNSLYGVKGPWPIGKSFAGQLNTWQTSNSKAIRAERLASIPSDNKTRWISNRDLEFYTYCATNDSARHYLRVPGAYRHESLKKAKGHQYWNAHDIRVPTLLARSQFDHWSRPIDIQTFYRDLQNAPVREKITLKNATHFVTADKPQQGCASLTAAIDRFIPLPKPATVTIDSLQTDQQVLTFVRTFDGMYSDFFLNPPYPLHNGPLNDITYRQTLGAHKWEKGDFDGNGRTDLLINGFQHGEGWGNTSNRESLVIFDLGPDSFRLQSLMLHSTIEFFAAKKVSLDDTDHIVALSTRRVPRDYRLFDSLQIHSDTLMYATGYFIEKAKPHHHKVHELYFAISGGFPYTPGFEMRIRQDSISLYNQPTLAPNDLDSGMFDARFDTSNLPRWNTLLGLVDFTRVDSVYSPNWTDDRTAYLNIRYDEDKTKNVQDYACIGTYGLAALYAEITRLRQSLRWTRRGKKK